VDPAPDDPLRDLVCALAGVGDRPEALVDVARAIRVVAGATLGPGDAAALAEAIAFLRRRALLVPAALAELDAAAQARVDAPISAPPPAATAAPPPPAPVDAAGPLAAASAWIDARLAGFTADPASPRLLPALKAIGELAHAGEILARGGGERAAIGRRWLDHGWRTLGGGALVLDVVGRTPRNVLAAALLPAFHRAGFAHPALAGAIARQLPRALLSDEEWAYLVPILGAVGVAPPPSAPAAAARASILAGRPAPWTLALAGAYQLAHEVFYATGWAGDPAALAPDAAAYVRRWLPAWLQLHVERADPDLVAELALAARCAGVAVAPAAWALLAGARRDDGAVRPPADRRVDLGADDPSDPAADDRARHLHPTLVAIMAWAAWT
jgi:Domain of unknown function (DUF6895)